jgi:hypothetical protein
VQYPSARSLGVTGAAGGMISVMPIRQVCKLV